MFWKDGFRSEIGVRPDERTEKGQWPKPEAWAPGGGTGLCGHQVQD